jgi:hypothetical protein
LDGTIRGRKATRSNAREIRDLAYLAHLGFERVIHGLAHDGFKSAADAEHASEAIRRVESQQPPIISDDPYAFAFNRQTMIWERFRSA